MKQTQRGRTGWTMAILIIVGLTIGAGLGLLLGWVVWPVEYFDTAIADLAVEHKEHYILLVASAYALDGDLDKAQGRLAELEAPNINEWVAQLTDRYISEGKDRADIQSLVELARGLGVDSPEMAAWLRPTPTQTPPPTDTPPPSPSPAPTETSTPLAPSDTPALPSETAPPEDTETPVPEPTDTPIPPSATPEPTSPPEPTNTPRPPAPTNTPKPPTTQWSWTARLVGPGEDSQACEHGNLQIRVTVIDANGGQIGGVWLYDKYSQQYQLTGNINSPDFGPGETKFEYGIGGGGSLCVANDQGGSCVSDYTRDMPCYNAPPFEDLWAAGYCECCEVGITKERCQELYNTNAQCMKQPRHYSWRAVFKRSH